LAPDGVFMNQTSNRIILVALFINALVIGGVLFLQKNLPPMLPLFYGLPLSEAQLAPSYALSLPPLISLIIVGVNTLIGKILKDNFLQKVLLALTIASTALSTITVLKIFFLVGQI